MPAKPSATMLVRLSKPATSDRLRLRITESAAVPCISEFALFKMPKMQALPTDARISKGNVSKANWKIIAATTGDAANAIDGNPDTFWHTHLMSGERNPPQSFDVDCGEDIQVSAFTYLPRQDHVAHGMTDKYRFEISRDGTRWVTLAEGEFSNIRANPIEQTVPLKNPVSARYFRFTGLHALEKNHISAAEVGVIAAP